MSLFSQADIPSFVRDRLDPVRGAYFPKATFSDAYLLAQIMAAEAEVSALLKTPLEPTAFFPYIPSQPEIDALNGMPWRDEPGYDYDPEFFRSERWGYIVTRQHPIIAVTAVNLVYPNPQNTVYAIPNNWLRLDRKYGHIRMVPASSQFVAPLGAFIMQALSGGSTIPSMIQVKYTAGIEASHPLRPLILDIVLKRATQKVMAGAMLPSSGSISADGLSQSLSIKLQDYEDQFQQAMFGPKGSNGGLYTGIHGIQSGVIGVTA